MADWEVPKGYTSEELYQEAAEIEEKLKTLDIQRRQEQLALESMEKSATDGVVYAEVDGVVKTLGDPDEKPEQGQAELVQALQIPAPPLIPLRQILPLQTAALPLLQQTQLPPLTLPAQQTTALRLRSPLTRFTTSVSASSFSTRLLTQLLRDSRTFSPRSSALTTLSSTSRTLTASPPTAPPSVPVLPLPALT